MGGSGATKMTDAEERLRLAASAASMALILGGIGAGIGHGSHKASKRARHQKTGAIAGAAIAGALSGVIFNGFLCGMFSSKPEQDEIDRILLPRRALGAASGVAAALVGGTLGSKVSKSHPTTGALVGAALSSAVAIAATTMTTCPTLPTGTSGVGQLRSEWAGVRAPTR
jgi:hypothetical protein